jgi:hypothetical protein
MVSLPKFPARENVNNGHEGPARPAAAELPDVISELVGSVSNTLVVTVSNPSLVIDDQSNVTCFESKVEKLVPGTDETVPAGDNNLRDQSLDALDDQGAKTGAVEVKSRTDVFDNCPSGVLFSKMRNLSIQISYMSGSAMNLWENQIIATTTMFTLLFVRRYSAIYVFISSLVRFAMLLELKNSPGVRSWFAANCVTDGANVVKADIFRGPDGTE